jgi:pyruvate formate lyase activating enzyme
VWLELTTLLIPGMNDGDDELEDMTGWVVEHLGPSVPMHSTAFHPDWKLRDRPPTPPATLRRARAIARRAGVRHAYTGNVHDPRGQTTTCHVCGSSLIGRDGYEVRSWGLDDAGACERCATPCAGVFEPAPGRWGSRRLPLRIGA